MNQKKEAGVKAAEYIRDGMIVGLGTGSTAFYMIERVGQLVKEGIHIKGVATSEHTKRLAEELNIPLMPLDEVDRIDLVIDGVDEIDPDFNAIKGGGGALFREKMVAMAAKEVIWIMDSSKRVDALGQFPLPVEILPFGYTHILRQMEEAELYPVLRKKDGAPYVTDNHNYIVDLYLGKGFIIQEILDRLSKITGVIETGLFLNVCSRIIIGTDHGVQIIENNSKKFKL